MTLNKLMIFEEKSIFTFFLEKKSYQKTIENDDFCIYENAFISEEWEEEKTYILFSESNTKKALEYAFENFLFEKIVSVWFAEILSNPDLKEGDIVIANTFLKWWKNPIFLENSIWENYDLTKFWLSLNWVCDSMIDLDSNEEKDHIDICDKDIYDVLLYIKDNSYYIEKTFSIKIVWKNNKETNIENAYNISDLII